MNYREYSLTKQDLQKTWMITCVFTGVIARLFYCSVWGCIWFPLLYYLVKQKVTQSGKERRNAHFLNAFLNGMRTLNSALQAGLSMERAFCEVERETKLLYGEEALFYQEIKELNHSVAMNIPIESLFVEFANRTGMEDVIQFAEVFAYGKRSGGNWRQIIDATVYRISEKYEVKQQIEVMIAEKKLEQQVMNCMPLGILLFLQLSSWEYMSVLYHNVFGVCVMTVVFVCYLAALYLSEKILSIKV